MLLMGLLQSWVDVNARERQRIDMMEMKLSGGGVGPNFVGKSRCGVLRRFGHLERLLMKE